MLAQSKIRRGKGASFYFYALQRFASCVYLLLPSIIFSAFIKADPTPSEVVSVSHLVDVNDPPAGVLAVGHDAEVDEVVGGVAVLPERVHSLDPAEPGLVPAAPIRDQYSGHQPITNTHPLDQSEASIAAS